MALLCIFTAKMGAVPHFGCVSCPKRLKSKYSVYQKQVVVGDTLDDEPGGLVVVPALPLGKLRDLGQDTGHPEFSLFLCVN